MKCERCGEPAVMMIGPNAYCDKCDKELWK